MKEYRISRQTPPSLDNMPCIDDENIGDVLEILYALIDACEDHYADPLRRWRELRYLELRGTRQADQYDLPLGEFDDEPF